MALNKTETIRNMRASVCRRELDALRTRRRRLRQPTEPGDDDRPTRRVQYSTRPNPYALKKSGGDD